jgi:Na+-driven multidrug efflux pump
MVRMPSLETLRHAVRPYFAIGLPAVVTQLATPVGNAFVTAEMSGFGDAAIAGWAIIGRITPVAFGAIFALSGAVGPILGQNFGARRFDRINQVMRDSFVVVIVYVLVVWMLLALFRNQISALFGATGAAAELINFFCLIGAASFLFNGLLFTANAAFNNLGFPLYSTISNWSRSTLGVIPFVSIGAAWYGAIGALAGSALGAVLFGAAAAFVCLRVVKDLERRNPAEIIEPAHPAAQSPFSSGKAATLG